MILPARMNMNDVRLEISKELLEITLLCNRFNISIFFLRRGEPQQLIREQIACLYTVYVRIMRIYSL